MTREEAIKRMKWTKGRTGITSEEAEAIGYAIEKLSNSDEDCISRQAVLNLMRGLTRWYVRSEDGKFNSVGLLYDDVMFGIDRLSSVTPKPKTDVLDKIRAEIEQEYKVESEHPYGEGLRRALEIIDKYKAESEDKE